MPIFTVAVVTAVIKVIDDVNAKHNDSDSNSNSEQMYYEWVGDVHIATHSSPPRVLSVQNNNNYYTTFNSLISNI